MRIPIQSYCMFWPYYFFFCDKNSKLVDRLTVMQLDARLLALETQLGLPQPAEQEHHADEDEVAAPVVAAEVVDDDKVTRGILKRLTTLETAEPTRVTRKNPNGWSEYKKKVDDLVQSVATWESKDHSSTKESPNDYTSLNQAVAALSKRFDEDAKKKKVLGTATRIFSAAQAEYFANVYTVEPANKKQKVTKT